MTDIRQSAEESLSDVVGAAIAFGGVDGAPEASDAPPLEELPEEEPVEVAEDLDETLRYLRKLSGAEAKVAFTCNAYQGAADPLAQEEYLQRRIATFGAVAASTRPAHPLSAGIASTVCAEWPLRPVSLTPKPVQGVQLQIVGHE